MLFLLLLLLLLCKWFCAYYKRENEDQHDYWLVLDKHLGLAPVIWKTLEREDDKDQNW